jgi:hypothetical protein
MLRNRVELEEVEKIATRDETQITNTIFFKLVASFEIISRSNTANERIDCRLDRIAQKIKPTNGTAS